MYGSGIYGQETYGGEHSGESMLALGPPLVTASFTVYAPSVLADLGLMVPLISNAFQVFAPAAVTIHGRPLAEDIRIMRVRRAD